MLNRFFVSLSAKPIRAGQGHIQGGIRVGPGINSSTPKPL